MALCKPRGKNKMQMLSLLNGWSALN